MSVENLEQRIELLEERVYGAHVQVWLLILKFYSGLKFVSSASVAYFCWLFGLKKWNIVLFRFLRRSRAILLPRWQGSTRSWCSWVAIVIMCWMRLAKLSKCARSYPIQIHLIRYADQIDKHLLSLESLWLRFCIFHIFN